MIAWELAAKLFHFRRPLSSSFYLFLNPSNERTTEGLNDVCESSSLKRKSVNFSTSSPSFLLLLPRPPPPPMLLLQDIFWWSNYEKHSSVGVTLLCFSIWNNDNGGGTLPHWVKLYARCWLLLLMQTSQIWHTIQILHTRPLIMLELLLCLHTYYIG